MLKKISACLVVLLACISLDSQAQTGELLINSSGQGNCINPLWKVIYSGYSGPVSITVHGLFCDQIGTNPVVVKQFTNGSCNSGGGGANGYTFSGSICGTWAVYKTASTSSSSSSTPATSTSTSTSSSVGACPYPGQVYQTNVPSSQMSTVMPVANSYCMGSSGNSACGAAATPYNYNGYGSPTAFTVYCR